jgi:hypothetical protein
MVYVDLHRAFANVKKASDFLVALAVRNEA